MRFMFIVKANQDSETGITPPKAVFAAMGGYNEALVRAGVTRAAEGLPPSSKRVRIRFSSNQGAVTDVPFTDTKEVIAGFRLWQVRAREEVVKEHAHRWQAHL